MAARTERNYMDTDSLKEPKYIPSKMCRRSSRKRNKDMRDKDEHISDSNTSESICRRLEEALHLHGPMKSKRLRDELTEQEDAFIFRTSGSTEKFVADHCSSIEINHGQFTYSIPADKDIHPSPQIITDIGNKYTKIMDFLKSKDVMKHIKGHYFNAYKEKIYLHIPSDKQQEIKELIKRNNKIKKYLYLISIEEVEESVAIPQTNGIMPYLTLGCRLMNDKPNRSVHEKAQAALHWHGHLTSELCGLSYGTLGCFVRNKKKTHTFAMTAKHVLDVCNDKVNIIAFTEDENIVKNTKANSLVQEDIRISMRDSLILGNSFLGMLDVNKDGQLIDIAIVGPFPDTFTTNLHQFNAKHIEISQEKHDFGAHEKVKIMGAKSGLRKGKIIATSFKPKIRFLEETGQAEVFLVTSCNQDGKEIVALSCF